MSNYAKAIVSIVGSVAMLVAVAVARNGIDLGEDWPQLIVAIVTPVAVWAFPNAD